MARSKLSQSWRDITREWSTTPRRPSPKAATCGKTPNGLYENHDPDQPDYNLRGRLTTDADGHFAFVAVRPVPYPIPADETAGELLRFMGHHPYRPGHIHFILAKDGYRTLVSQVFDSSSDWLDNDSVFAVKDSLVADFTPSDDGKTDLKVRFDFVMKAQANDARIAAE